MSPSAQTILQFSYLQLAAEAVDLETGIAGNDLFQRLTDGNGRASAFTTTNSCTATPAGGTLHIIPFS